MKSIFLIISAFAKHKKNRSEKMVFLSDAHGALKKKRDQIKNSMRFNDCLCASFKNTCQINIYSQRNSVFYYQNSSSN